MSQRKIAKGKETLDGSKVQLLQIVQDQDGRWRTENFLDPVPAAEADTLIDEYARGPLFRGRWNGPLPSLF
jgi:hypothetical protein